jgi:hypothetical protein
MKIKFMLLVLMAVIYGCKSGNRTSEKTENLIPSNLFQYSDNVEPRWVSFENMSGSKGRGGMENNGAKGHACDSITAGATKTLLKMDGPGIINRMWVTINDRSPEMLRSLIINMYWDNEVKPAVSVPFGDFFGIGLGKTAVYENALFANPEGRSFNCFIQMPFKKAARIELVNQSSVDLPMVFYDIDLQLLNKWDDSFLYFHSYWHRDTATVLEKDFEIMPMIKGKGRFLGSNISVNANPKYKDCWWGEGEVKIYLNGDDKYPTMVGSGTEDYIGTAWGQGQFSTRFTGCLIADSKNLQWAFYRYHITDPVYFKSDCRVTIQQIGGNNKDIVIAMLKQKVDLVPVTVHKAPVMTQIFKKESIANLEDPALPNAWTNFYRSDDLAATSYFYLDSPKNDLPELQPLKIRTWKLKKEKL